MPSMDRISTPVRRFDAIEKADGSADYVSDLKFDELLYAKTVRSGISRGKIVSITYPALPEGYSIIDKDDVPAGGKNRILMITDDWPVFAEEQIRFNGQTIALVVGPDREMLESLSGQIVIEYDTQPPAFTIPESLAQHRDFIHGGRVHGGGHLFADHQITKGTPDQAFSEAAGMVREDFHTGYQEHIYLEPQGCVADWEDNKIIVYASMQCPFYIKKAIVHALGCEQEDVQVRQPHTGGAFGGKEHYPDVLATAAAIAVRKLKRPVKLILDRQEDILFTPKRHPAWITIKSAIDSQNNITGMEVDIRLNAGAFETCSNVVLQRAIFSATGVYDIPNVKIRGRAFATNTVPSGAFRGFGAPQVLFAIEMHMDHLARKMGTDPVDFKRRYFITKGSLTVTNGRMHDEVPLEKMVERILGTSGYREKSKGEPRTCEPHGASPSIRRRTGGRRSGIGISFFNHGCGFTGSGESEIIRGKIILRKNANDQVRILSAGVDMGQGLLTTFRKIVSEVLEISPDKVLFDRPDTMLIPNSGPTCASRSIMVVGYLLQEAAKKLKSCWEPETEQEITQEYTHPRHLTWDQETLTGDAYPAWGWGVNAVEVEVDPVTFEVETKNIWTIYDVGVLIDRLIVEGQAHGGMIQALGFAGLEKMEIVDGSFYQRSMADYMIPTSLDFPSVQTDFVQNPYAFGPFGAKGGGELVFDGGAPAYAAAVQQATGIQISEIPVTPEKLMELWK